MLATLAAVGAAAAGVGRAAGLSGPWLAGVSALSVLLFLPVVIPLAERWRSALAARLRRRPLRSGAAWLGWPGLVACAWCGASGGGLPLALAGKYALYAGVPLWALARARGRPEPRDPFERPGAFVLAVLVLWWPVEFGLFRGCPLVPGVGGPDVARVLGLGAAVTLFTAVAPVPRLGYTLRWSSRDVARAAAGLAAFGAVGLPLALASGFVRFGLAPFDPVGWALRAFGIYWLVALPEEFLFRGLIQNGLERLWRDGARGSAAWLVASAIFGAAHLNNPPAPNARYAALAFLAGLAYGWVWRRTRKVTVAACTHAAVDWLWAVAFTG